MLRNVLECPKIGFVLRHCAPGNSMVLGLAINRDGLLIRHWVLPGSTVDVTTVEEAVNDLLGLRSSRFLFIGDRGLVSQKNLDFLESRRLHYLLGSKLQDNGVVQEEVLTLRGLYGKVTETLGVKEIRIRDGGRTVRYLLCWEAERVAEDQAGRQKIVARLQEELDESRTAAAHTRKTCTLWAHRGYARCKPPIFGFHFPPFPDCYHLSLLLRNRAAGASGHFGGPKKTCR
jgi:hypothetical protein